MIRSKSRCTTFHEPFGVPNDKKSGQVVFQLCTILWGSGYGWVVPAEPSTHYVFTRSVRTTDPTEEPDTLEAVDMRQLNALRELGYIGDKKEDR